MRDWLEPRQFFVLGVERALATPGLDLDRFASALSKLGGESSLVVRLLDVSGRAGLAARYRALREAEERRRAPVQLIVALTYRCNRKCPYCYAYESQDEYAADIDLGSAREVLDWAVRERAELISFTGGEPTCHPHFAELVSEVGRRGMQLYLNTNGLFGEGERRALSASFVKNVGLHVSERRVHRPGELSRIFANARALREAGVEVFLRHTLWRTSHDDVDWIVASAAEHGIEHLNLALGFPGRSATNRYLPADRFIEVKPLLFRALDLAARRGVRVRSSKPLPLCLFTRAEYARFQRHHEMASVCTVHQRGGVHNLVVNPDLGTYPCVGLPFKGPKLTATSGYGAQRAATLPRLKRALAVVQTGCEGCALLPLGVCQASCLGHCGEAGAADRDAQGVP